MDDHSIMTHAYVTDDMWQDDSTGSSALSTPSDGLEDTLSDIAVIGLSVKFPQDCDSAEGFWRTMMGARSAMTEVPPERWNAGAFHSKTSRSGTVREIMLALLNHILSTRRSTLAEHTLSKKISPSLIILSSLSVYRKLHAWIHSREFC